MKRQAARDGSDCKASKKPRTESKQSALGSVPIISYPKILDQAHQTLCGYLGWLSQPINRLICEFGGGLVPELVGLEALGAELNKALDTQGVVVVKGVLSTEEALVQESAIWDFLETTSVPMPEPEHQDDDSDVEMKTDTKTETKKKTKRAPPKKPVQVSRHDPSTWIPKNWPIGHQRGMFKQVGQLDVQWRGRQQESIFNVYSAIHGTSQLLVSQDALQASYPVLRGTDEKERRSWLHCDQGHTRIGRNTIQGVLTIRRSSGGLCILVGSHASHQEAFAEFPELKNKKGDFIKFADEQLKKVYSKYPLICLNYPTVDAGDLCLWRSDLVHQGARPRRPNEARFASYICMHPWKDAKDKKHSQKVFINQRCASHDPICGTWTGKKPHFYSVLQELQWQHFVKLMAQLPKRQMTPRGMQLVGGAPESVHT